MNEFYKAMQVASEQTKILKTRKNSLFTFGPTRLPYICLCTLDTLQVSIYRGEVKIDRAQLTIPGATGLDLSEFNLPENPEQKPLIMLLARGIQLPQGQYANQVMTHETRNISIKEAIDITMKQLEDADDTRTGVIVGPDDYWLLSLLLYVGNQAAKSAPDNIAEILERMRRQELDGK